MTELILIADDDADIRRFVEINLRPEGFDTISAADGDQALRFAFEHQPALVLLDVMMPKLDGFEVCRRLRADFRTASTPVIMLTARSLSADKVVGLTAGADDYIIKPFDPLELVARVKSTLRRASEMRDTSPLTGLPGNTRIDAEIRTRAQSGESFAVCYLDLDNFKSYNDHYGFLRGDQAIGQTAEVIKEAARRAAPDSFVGHIGGDDFIVLCRPDQVESFCKSVVDGFDESVASLYDPADAEAGGIDVPSRQGTPVRYPLISISIGVSTASGGKPIEGLELVDRATEMKSQAKRQPGSLFLVDRRGL